MMIAIMAVYLALLFALFWLGIIRFNAFWKMSPLIVLLQSSFNSLNCSHARLNRAIATGKRLRPRRMVDGDPRGKEIIPRSPAFLLLEASGVFNGILGMARCTSLCSVASSLEFGFDGLPGFQGHRSTIEG